MPTTFDCATPAGALAGVREARKALGSGALAIVPTDTVYGIAADAFSATAVAALLAAKGRGRSAPPPVLIPDLQTLRALAVELPPTVDALAEAFWPGPLTVIAKARPSLTWDLGDTGGTVALRVPHHELALALLAETGPLAVSSANRHGEPAATTVEAAAEALGDRVAVVLDAGVVGAQHTPHEAQNGSTIIDATGERLRIVRQGVLAREAIAAVVGEDSLEP